MSTQDFLVEIGTEELPPKALSTLSRSFEAGIVSGLGKEQLSFTAVRRFATPRRLAVLVSGLVDKQADMQIEKFGPAIKAAYDADGKPTRAALGFAKSCKTDVPSLSTLEKDGVEKLFFSATLPGKLTRDLLPEIVRDSLARLPIPKRMRWGASREEFVRPVHWVNLLFGNDLIDTTIFGVASAAYTFGHRFHHNEKIHLPQASDYEFLLESVGSVIPDFNKRKQLIRELVTKEGSKHGATAVIDEALLDEVTGLVEFPVALTGKFEEHYLEVPSEALILAMKSHQKYFHLVDDNQKLLPFFVTVSNIRSNDPEQVVKGNERVIRPRLADARFFYETDKQQTLQDRLEQLKKVVFQEKLGSVYQRTLRVARLAKSIASTLGENEDFCHRAAMLAKCDLVSNMVGEFADLQGVMGSYYAVNDGEPAEVAAALRQHYMPRYSGDDLPDSMTGCILAIADKLDSIVGLFAIGQPPTGSKDPFALRRSSIGILRILVEKEIDLDILACIQESITGFVDIEIEANLDAIVFEFFLERFRSWYVDEGIASNIFQSVIALKPPRPLDFHRRILAVHHFNGLEQSAALAAANKRVSNLLAKLDGSVTNLTVNSELLQENAEKQLHATLNQKELDVAPLFDKFLYREGLEQLAQLRECVDVFFDEVLVMCEDQSLRENRIALLQRLRAVFLRVADISYLQS